MGFDNQCQLGNDCTESLSNSLSNVKSFSNYSKPASLIFLKRNASQHQHPNCQWLLMTL